MITRLKNMMEGSARAERWVNISELPHPSSVRADKFKGKLKEGKDYVLVHGGIYLSEEEFNYYYEKQNKRLDKRKTQVL